MPTKDALDAARSAYFAVDACKAVILQELGLERVLALRSSVLDSAGAAHGRWLRAETGIEQADTWAAFSLLAQVLELDGFGVELVECTPQRATFKTGPCPIYEASRLNGLDHAAIEANCRAGRICFMDAVTRQLNPRLHYRLRRFRSATGGACVEEIVLNA